MSEICKIIHDEDIPLCLKGGTSLFLAYGLDRFSEDLDFDITKDIESFLNVEGICEKAVKNLNKNNAGIKILGFGKPKKTNTTHRCKPLFLLKDGSTEVPIKIEISRRNPPSEDRVFKVNNTKTYSPDDIARMKIFAASPEKNQNSRVAARDLHDIIFLATKKERHLSSEVISDIETFLSDLTELAVTYEDAYQSDEILSGKLFADLERAEAWIESRKDPKGPLFDV